jgi:ATP-dependent RNA helicase MSS116, mitochondrial
LNVVGGTNIEGDRRTLFGGKPPSVVVGTPGRLLDHLENDVKFRDLCRSVYRICIRTYLTFILSFYLYSGVLVQILDEADRLLDMGFKKDVDKILQIVATHKKSAGISWDTQTLLFSATVDQEIRGIAAVCLKKGYKLIDTVGEEDQTHSHVPQFVTVATLEQQITTIAAILEEQMRGPHKIIVFFATARQSQLMAGLFTAAGVPALEMHARMSQPARIRTTDAFRSGSNLIMFSSDVS